MRIAVTYDNGNVFQHYGKTSQFKIYEVQQKEVVKSWILDTNGQGHSALGSLLQSRSVDLLICGGIGQGAINVLTDLGIKIVNGVYGNTDECVNNYLNGTLISMPRPCNHHGEGHVCH